MRVSADLGRNLRQIVFDAEPGLHEARDLLKVIATLAAAGHERGLDSDECGALERIANIALSAQEVLLHDWRTAIRIVKEISPAT